jgi:hypothetical protein
MLLKTINKDIKKLLIRKIRSIAEKYYLFYLSQIEAQAEQGTGIALELFISIIQTV